MATEMGTIREQRYKELRQYYHCIHMEAREFSKIDYKHPSAIYLLRMLESIRQQYEMHKKLGGTDQQWSQKVLKAYRQKGFIHEEVRNGRIVRTIDPYQRLRAVEDVFKKMHPDWESPHIKKWADFKRTQSELERVLKY